MGKKLGWILAAGLLVAGCGAGAPQVKDSGNVGVLDAPSSTSSAPAYSVPVTTPTATSEAPVVTTAPTQAQVVAPKTATPKPKAAPKTTAPKSAECGADYYVNSSGNCVHRPSDNPAGATAICKDGSYSYSQHRSGTCSGHGGVRSWL